MKKLNAVSAGFDDQTISKIIKISQDFDFQAEDLIKQLIRLFIYETNTYLDRLNSINKQRGSCVKKELRAIKKQAEKLNDLLESTSLATQLTFFTHWKLVDELRNHLNKFYSAIPALINSTKDEGGRPHGSMPQFLIFHLLKIYIAGTGKIPKLGWDSANDKGTGDGYSFLLAVTSILSAINPRLQLGTKKAMCNTAIEIMQRLTEVSPS